ncbi:MAG: type VI secretion system baseplate subunit TssK [Alphaproteobacteria bacterium]|nr:type VI secretion system baseplate subunit TssK [Alphaproteobacteria bacterium]
MRVVWKEGLFVAPHHLQVHDRLQEEQSWLRHRLLTRGAGGVIEVRVDATQLAAGVLQLSRVRVVFPDGTPADIGGVHDPPPGRPLPAGARGKPIGVHLGLPAYQEKLPNLAVSADPSLEPRRYRSRTVTAFDAFGEAGSVDVELAVPALSVLFDGDDMTELHTMKLAEVERGADGAWTLSRRFVPPVLCLGASDVLVELLEQLQGQLHTARRGFLAQRAALMPDAMTLAAAKLLLLCDVVEELLARVDHALMVRDLSPERAYEALVAAAGRLNAWRDPSEPVSLPPYRPSALFDCFSELCARITAQLVVRMPSPHTRIPFEQRDANLWEAALSDELLHQRASWVFVLRGAGGTVDDPGLISSALKLAAPDDLSYYVRRRRQGVRVDALPAPPRGVPPLDDALFFSLRQTGDEWRDVTRSGVLGLHIPDGFPGLVPELFVVTDRGGGAWRG